MKYAIMKISLTLDPNDSGQKAQRGKGWGKEDQARYDAIVKAKGKANAHQSGGATGKPENAIDQTTTGKADSVYSNYETTQEQNVNQDNDINTNVNGNNNTVVTEQDNSVRYYGGDNRSFVLQRW